MSFSRYPAYKDSGVDWLGPIPASWNVCALKRIVSLQSGDSITSEQIEGDGTYPVYGGNGLRGYCEAFTHDGQFALIGRQGALCGNINYAHGKFWASEHAVVVTPKQAIATRWIGELLRAMNLNQYSVSAAQPGLSVEIVGNLGIPVPSSDEQQAIASYLDRETAKIDALVAEQEQLISLLKEKRQAVISHAVTKGLDPSVPMKDSGVEWLGEVPAHWVQVRLGALFRQQKRQDFPDLDVLSVYRDFGVIPKDSRTDNFNKTPEKLDAYQLVEIGDLVVNKMKAWQGSLGISDYRGITSPDYVVFSPSAEANPVYIHLLLRSSGMVSVYRSISNGIRPDQWRLEPDSFLGLKVYMPPIAEQAEIAAAVTARDESFVSLIEESERSTKLLAERRSALITAAVTGQIDVRQLA